MISMDTLEDWWLSMCVWRRSRALNVGEDEDFPWCEQPITFCFSMDGNCADTAIWIYNLRISDLFPLPFPLQSENSSPTAARAWIWILCISACIVNSVCVSMPGREMVSCAHWRHQMSSPWIKSHHIEADCCVYEDVKVGPSTCILFRVVHQNLSRMVLLHYPSTTLCVCTSLGK